MNLSPYLGGIPLTHFMKLRMGTVTPGVIVLFSDLQQRLWTFPLGSAVHKSNLANFEYVGLVRCPKCFQSLPHILFSFSIIP